MGIMPDQLQKRDAGKIDPLMYDEDLALATEAETAVLAFGKEKYGSRGGWMAVDMDRYKGAAARHRRERMKHGIGNQDAETNLLHIAHEIINLKFLLEMHIRANPHIDFTRYNKPVPVAPMAYKLPPLIKVDMSHTDPWPNQPLAAQKQQFDGQPDYHTQHYPTKGYSSHGRDGTNDLD